MGADGSIVIWRDDVVRKEFPDCDELFRCLPTHYRDELDGVKYHHCYYGDNLDTSWGWENDWYTHDIKDDEKKMKRLRKFVEWLEDEANGAVWEVWT